MKAKKDFAKSAKKTEWSGQHSPMNVGGQYVAKTQAEWEKLWDAANGNSFPAPKAPKLPKGKMAVGVFYGQTSGNVSVAINNVSDKGGNTIVEWSHSAEPSMIRVMREPYALKIVDLSDLPVVFTKVTAEPTPTKPGNLGNLPPRR